MGVPHPSVPVVAQTDWLKCSEAPLSDPNFSFVLLLVPLSPPPPQRSQPLGTWAPKTSPYPRSMSPTVGPPGAQEANAFPLVLTRVDCTRMRIHP